MRVFTPSITMSRRNWPERRRPRSIAVVSISAIFVCVAVRPGVPGHCSRQFAVVGRALGITPGFRLYPFIFQQRPYFAAFADR